MYYKSLVSLTKNTKVLSRMFSKEAKDHILTKEIGDKAVIIINRPKSLNAITPFAQIQFVDALQKLEKEKSIIIIKGAGDRAFCSGGDLLKIKEEVFGEKKEGPEMVYSLNGGIYLIHACKIPIIALMNGITFGGGAGIAYFCKYRIATEKTVFAMPESKIAFHPNAGGTYFLNRARGRLGTYLGLSGNALKGSDVVQAGFATHYCLSNNLEKLEKAILSAQNPNDIKDIIDDNCEKNIPEFTLSPVIDTIDKCFSEPTVKDIILKLENYGSDWAKKTGEDLRKYSPSALTVILRQLQKGKSLDVEECLAMESNISFNIFYHPDILEGIRTILVNKGDMPKWNPSNLDDVTEELIDSYFEPVIEKKLKQFLLDLQKYPISKL